MKIHRNVLHFNSFKSPNPHPVHQAMVLATIYLLSPLPSPPFDGDGNGQIAGPINFVARRGRGTIASRTITDSLHAQLPPRLSCRQSRRCAETLHRSAVAALS